MQRNKEMKRYLFYISLAILLAKYSADNVLPYADIECDPDINCLSATLGDSVPDPANCSNYYLCVQDTTEDILQPSDVVFPCPTNQTFDAKIGECVNNPNGCINPCKQYTCPAYCSIYNYEKIAYGNDCSKFYQCYPDDGPVELPCPVDYPYFDGYSCSDDLYACCDICTPLCNGVLVQVPDPLDCHSFYLCTSNLTLPTEDEKHECPSGTYFDPASTSCAEEIVACSPLCLSTASYSSSLKHTIQH